MRAALTALASLAVVTAAQAQDQPVWTPGMTKEEAFLTYAIPESDDLGVALSCRRKSGQIMITFLAEQRLATRLSGERWVDRLGRPAPWPVSVTLVSGAQRTTIPGLAHADEMNGGSQVTVEVADMAPVLGEFGRSGLLRAEALGTVVQPPPVASGPARRFIGACRK